MDNENKEDQPKVQAEDNSIAIGGISIGGDVGGNIHIGHTTGYTAKQVSVLITQITSTFQPKPFDGRCPYKGLDVFQEDDAEFFFGREKLIDDLVNRVKLSRTLFITGPSGSGKSSLVRAGLIYALKQERIKNNERWLYETMKPGRDPIGELARVASSFAATLSAGEDIRTKGLSDATVLAQWCEIALKEGRDKRVVLFIDQFEEVFTQISNEAERVAFLNLLTHAATVENGRVIVLFSMRSDFVSNCATFPQINALLNQQFIQIGAMQPEELVSAIAQPALRVGLRIDPDLIAQIINDMQGEPGALPLMQFALKDLFDSQKSKDDLIALTLNDYLERGGIRKSLERHADAAFAKLNTHEQELARSIFSGLIEIGRGTQDTRRTALFDELVPAGGKATDVKAVVQKLADARLITTDEKDERDTVTLAHEKLIDAWPWLKKLVNENRDVIALQNEIANDTKEWEDNRRDPSYLFTGARLASAREHLEAKNLVLSGSAHEFVIAGQAQERRGRTTRIIGIAVPIGLVIFAIMLFSYLSTANSAAIVKQSKAFAETQQASANTSQANADKAQLQAEIAGSRELAALARAKSDSQPDLSLLLSIEAFNQNDNYQTRGVLLDSIQILPNLNQFLFGDTTYANTLVFSLNGKHLASSSCSQFDGPFCIEIKIIIWDMEKRLPVGQPVFIPASGEGTPRLYFSSNGDFIYIDVETVRYQMDIAKIPSAKDFVLATNVLTTPHSPFEVSSDGMTIAQGDHNAVTLYEASTYQPIGELKAEVSIGTINQLAFSQNNKVLITGSCLENDGNGNCSQSRISLWDLITHELINDPSPISGAIKALSPYGKILAVANQNGAIDFIDTATNQAMSSYQPAPDIRVRNVILSPDQKTAALVMDNGLILLWDIYTARQIGEPLKGSIYDSTNMTFSPNGEILATSSDNISSIMLWNAADQKPLLQTMTNKPDTFYSIAFSPDGILHSVEGNDVLQWDIATGINIGAPQRITGKQLFFDPNGNTIASVMDDGDTMVFDAKTGKSIIKLPTRFTDNYRITFSSNGNLIASASCEEDPCRFPYLGKLWDVFNHDRVDTLPISVDGDISSFSFSPNGRVLAISGCPQRTGAFCSDNVIQLWDTETRRFIGQVSIGYTNDITSLAFNHKGNILASGIESGETLLWDVENYRALGEPLLTASDQVVFSPDDKFLASADYNGNLSLWDVESHQRIGQPLKINKNYELDSLAFSPDGRFLVAGGCNQNNDFDCEQGNIILLDVNPDSWMKKACSIVGRNLTRAEWALYTPYKPYPPTEEEATCPQWPVEPEIIPTPLPPLALPDTPTPLPLPTIFFTPSTPMP